MKRWLAAAVLIFLLTISAATYADGLFPAKAENGLYGYINAQAEWTIDPQWVMAMNFRGDYAVVSDREDESDWYTEGLIDTRGTPIIDCGYLFDEGYDGWCYGGIDTGIWVVWTDDSVTDKWGYFDVPSGYFSGLIYDAEIRCWGNSSLIPVMYEGELWYIRCNTGELIVGPVAYSAYWIDPPYFLDGYASLEESGGLCSFLAMDGSIAVADPAYVPYPYDCYYGLCPAQNRETGLWGYLSMKTGELAIDAVYAYAHSFSYQGYACVKLTNGTYGHIDLDGNLIAQGFQSAYYFSRGYAYVKAQGILIDTAGETVFTVPQGYQLQSFTLYNDQPDDVFYVTDNDLVVLYATDGGLGSGFMNLDGEWVIPPEYQFSNEDYLAGNYAVFCNGAQAVWKWVDGNFKYAYFDGNGRLITDFIYDSAGAFYQGGLARVWRDGMTGYINLQGEEVYMWEDDD